jgi:DNA-binding GntR family transcriptional regulator
MTPAQPFTPEIITVSTLRAQVLAALRARIVTGQISVGTVYSARTLAQELGVSPTPVREALLDLVKEGVCEMVRNRGFRVTVPTEEELDEILELRLMLEVPMTGRVAGRLGPASEPRFRRLVEEMRLGAADGDLRVFLSADRDFHLGLLSLGGNQKLVELVGLLRDQARLYALPDLDRELLVQSADEHEPLLEAIVSGDAPLAERLMHQHLQHTRGVWAGVAESALPAKG